MHVHIIKDRIHTVYTYIPTIICHTAHTTYILQDIRSQNLEILTTRIIKAYEPRRWVLLILKKRNIKTGEQPS